MLKWHAWEPANGAEPVQAGRDPRPGRLPDPCRGLDNAGKTTILKHLTGGDVNSVSPTLGFNIETIEMRGYAHHPGGCAVFGRVGPHLAAPACGRSLPPSALPPP